MPHLLHIRFIQIKRELYVTGPLVIVVFGFLFYLICVSFKYYEKSPDAFYLTAILFFICLMIQFYRNDKSFVYNHIDGPHLEIYLEYVSLTFPFAISALLTKNWFCYPILVALLGAIPFLNYSVTQRTYFKNISSIVPPAMFEWISGFRKSFLFLIPLYISAIGFCWFRFLPLFILWLISGTIASFYIECEPLQILKEGNPSSKVFLKRKLFEHSKYMLLFFAPILILNTVFNFEYWLINLLFIPIQLSLLCFAICLKYSNYQANKNLIGNNMLMTLMTFGALIPYLLPIPLLMTIFYYGRAKNNLNYYLND